MAIQRRQVGGGYAATGSDELIPSLRCRPEWRRDRCVVLAAAEGHVLEVWLDAPVGGAGHDELLSTIADALRKILTSVSGSGNSPAQLTDRLRLPLLRRPGEDDSPFERSARALLRLYQFVAFKLPAADDAIVDVLLPVFAPSAADLARISATIADGNVDAILHWHDRDGTDAMVRLDRRTQRTLRDLLARTAFGQRHDRITGRLVGTGTAGRSFEIRTPDAVVAGQVAHALVDRLGSCLGCQVVATLEVSTAHLMTDGRIRESVSLIDVAVAEDPLAHDGHRLGHPLA